MIKIKEIENFPEDIILLMPEGLITPTIIYSNLGMKEELNLLLDTNKEKIGVIKNINKPQGEEQGE